MNAGKVFGNWTGIGIDSVSVFSGNVSNTGTISAAFWGVAALDFNTFTGSVINKGTISARRVGRWRQLRDFYREYHQ